MITFIKNLSGRYKTRFWFVLFMGLLALFLIWPGYALLKSPTPFILGFPLSFAWVIICTIAGFIALLLLYRSDNKRGDS